MKAKALANCEIAGQDAREPWREDAGLMKFLWTL